MADFTILSNDKNAKSADKDFITLNSYNVRDQVARQYISDFRNQIAELSKKIDQVDASKYATKDEVNAAIQQVHTHTNKTILDSITQDMVNKWNNCVQSSSLSKVATSGSYNDLIDKPNVDVSGDMQKILDDLATYIQGEFK